jgi:hypothetical protein
MGSGFQFLPLRFWALASPPSAKDCVCSSGLATAICCRVCSFVGHCAGVTETANLVRAIAKLSAAPIVHALSELGWVIVYATDREKCSANANVTLTALETGCGRA